MPSPSAPAPAYLSGLNDPQRLAVTTLDGPVLVLSGAGTGKTRVLVTRLVHLLKTNTCWPSQILAVTFTNKAAGEMRERVAHMMGQPVEGWWLGTFHALAARMLRTHAEKVGLTQGFTILDDDDQQRLIKQLLEADNIDTKKCPPRMVLSIISRWKDKGLTPQDVAPAQAGASRQLDPGLRRDDSFHDKIPQLYRQYQDRLRTVNACDFGDLLLHMITILKNPKYGDILNEYRRKFRYILVDEYQDTNTAQYIWLRLLAGGTHNICCVGDDDQSIYGWRGAEIENILRFERDFPGAITIRLEQNYRSTGHILASASAIIAKNQSRLGKTLWSDSDMGDKVRVEGVWDGEAEARFISDTIERSHARGTPLSTFAILVRAGFQMREFEDRFLKIGLPYRVFGGPRFYERAEIRDALAYFRVVVQPNDDLALERIINTPKRGLGDTTLQMLHANARAQGISLYAAIDKMIAAPGALKPKIRDTLSKLITDFNRWRSLLSDDNHGEMAGVVLDESGYTAMWQADKSPDAPGRLENLKELVGTIGDYPSLPAFLEHVSLVMENANNAADDTVSVMTLHAAKGLEFDTVFLPGWEEGIFPSTKSVDENGVAGLEEERRLAYVGITRARKSATILCAGSRRQYGNWVQNMPSRFIGELPPDHITMSGAVGTAFSQPDNDWDHPSTSSQFDNRSSDRWENSRRYDQHNHRPTLSSGGSTPALQSSVNKPITSPTLWPAGTRVKHADFGTGIVIHAAGQKLDIKFNDGPTRRIMSSFVEII